MAVSELLEHSCSQSRDWSQKSIWRNHPKPPFHVPFKGKCSNRLNFRSLRKISAHSHRAVGGMKFKKIESSLVAKRRSFAKKNCDMAGYHSVDSGLHNLLLPFSGSSQSLPRLPEDAHLLARRRGPQTIHSGWLEVFSIPARLARHTTPSPLDQSKAASKLPASQTHNNGGHSRR